ncbi:hypothetical protein SMA5143A_7792 [Streptomyces sp. MA5143a]|nr:hypothetical protein SMA5143A_7792 [Streptomyces sp. MA5143a]
MSAQDLPARSTRPAHAGKRTRGCPLSTGTGRTKRFDPGREVWGHDVEVRRVQITQPGGEHGGVRVIGTQEESAATTVIADEKETRCILRDFVRGVAFTDVPRRVHRDTGLGEKAVPHAPQCHQRSRKVHLRLGPRPHHIGRRCRRRPRNRPRHPAPLRADSAAPTSTGTATPTKTAPKQTTTTEQAAGQHDHDLRLEYEGQDLDARRGPPPKFRQAAPFCTGALGSRSRLLLSTVVDVRCGCQNGSCSGSSEIRRAEIALGCTVLGRRGSHLR